VLFILLLLESLRILSDNAQPNKGIQTNTNNTTPNIARTGSILTTPITNILIRIANPPTSMGDKISDDMMSKSKDPIRTNIKNTDQSINVQIRPSVPATTSVNIPTSSTVILF
jgi:hypothetical protein